MRVPYCFAHHRSWFGRDGRAVGVVVHGCGKARKERKVKKSLKLEKFLCDLAFPGFRKKNLILTCSFSRR